MTLKQSSLKKESNKDQEYLNSLNDFRSEKSPEIDKILISIIIPMYNEENSIKNVVSRLPNHQNYEILIVDDGSTDNSFNIVSDIDNREIRLIKHEKNRGYGAAIITGFKEAKGDIIVTMDSDGQHNPEEISALISPIMNKEADIVVGSRYLGNSTYKVPTHTFVGELFINKCLWFLFKQYIANNQSGFRAFHKNTLCVFDNLIYNNFGLCTEILFKAAYNEFQIAEVPITVNRRQYGSSSVNLIKIFISISSCILIYGLQKFKILKFIPRLIAEKLKKKLIK